MEDTLQKYLGKTVLVNLDQEKYHRIPYIGKVAGYDKDFIRLNPVVDCNIPYLGEKENAIAKIKEFSAGSTNSEIILGRGVIAALEEVVIE